MFFKLLKKEFIDNFTSKKNFSSILLYIVTIGLFIALEVYIFLSLNTKIEEYSQYGTYDFLIFFLFIMMLISIFSGIYKARKVLFDSDDFKILTILPISNKTIVFSKIIFIYINEVLITLFISTPLLIAYFFTKDMGTLSYFFALIYPFIISIFAIAITLVFVVLYEYIYKLIKKSDFVQFVIASALVIGLCFIYQTVLNLFLTALNDSAIGGVFSPSFIDTIHNSIKYFFPINLLIEGYTNKDVAINSFIIFCSVAFIILVIGIIITSLSYNKVNKRYISISKNNNIEKQYKIGGSMITLLKKEFGLLFKDSTYTFSYTALLIMCPFLTYVVLSSLNAIAYENLKIYIVYFPELINGINMSLIVIFTLVINASASLSITREGKSVQIIKYLPISSKKQIFAKLVIPILFSSISVLITCLVLYFTKIINLSVFVSSLLISLIMIFFTNILGIYIDMKNRTIKKTKIAWINSSIALVYPFLILALHFILSFTQVETKIIYITEIGLSLGILIILCVVVFSKLEKIFTKMEVN